MRVMIAGEEAEAIPLSDTLVLLRGCLGGQRPELLHPDALYGRATFLPERRESQRRFARHDRRRAPRNDRRGFAHTWLEQKGRRRGDVFSVADDRLAAEQFASVRARLGIAR